jgi:sugar lactone lactonase YvrE
MRTDSQENGYIAHYGAGEVVVLSSKGGLLNTVKLTGQYPTNILFGRPQGDQVFVTMQTCGATESFFSQCKSPAHSDK